MIPLSTNTGLVPRMDMIKHGIWAFSLDTAMRSCVFKAKSYQQCEDWLKIILECLGIKAEGADRYLAKLKEANQDVTRDAKRLERANFGQLMSSPLVTKALKLYVKDDGGEGKSEGGGGGSRGAFQGTAANCVRLYQKIGEYGASLEQGSPAATVAYSINRRFLRDRAENKVKMPGLEIVQNDGIYNAKNPDRDGADGKSGDEEELKDALLLFLQGAENITVDYAEDNIVPGFKEADGFQRLLEASRLCQAVAPAGKAKKTLVIRGKTSKLKKGENSIGRDRVRVGGGGAPRGTAVEHEGHAGEV